MAETDFAALIVDVAKHPDIWGEPNPRVSKKNELRWGSHGARSVVPSKGTWFDNENEQGGGTLDLVMRELAFTTKKDALRWLEDQGFMSADDRPKQPRARRQDPGAQPDERPAPSRREIAAEYEYTDEAGKPLFVVVRYKIFGPEQKTFRQRTPNGSWSVKGVRPVVYRLPDVLAAIERGEPIYIVEGEKDVHNARDLLGITATCNAGGAGKWTEEHSKLLRGADVVWLPDNDDAGRGHVTTGAISLRKYAKAQRVLDLPGLDEKEDLTDWIDNGNGPADLEALVRERARLWTPEAPESKFGALPWEHLDSRPDEEHHFIVDEFFTEGDISAIAGPSGSGKSFLAIDVGMKVAVAAMPDLPELTFFGRRIVAGGLVCYQAGEAARGVKKRLRAFRKAFSIPSSIHLPFILLTRKVDLWRDKDIEPFIAEIKAWQAYYNLPLKMIFIDTFAAAIPGAEENSAKDMSTVNTNIARIRDECGCHVCLVHHMNAAGTKLRGSTAIFAGLDNVVSVVRDEATKIRTVELSKQKDEEDDKSFRFELERIELGWDEKRNKPNTSCVCREVGQKDAAARLRDKGGFKLKDNEHRFFKALIDTLKKKGVVPPFELEVPGAIGCVADYEDFRAEYRATEPHDADEDDADFKERTKKAMGRAGSTLTKFSVIASRSVGDRKTSYLWWTHKPVAGFSRSPIEPPASAEEETGLMAMMGANSNAEATEDAQAEDDGRSTEPSS